MLELPHIKKHYNCTPAIEIKKKKGIEMSFQLSTRELEIHERAYKELKNLISDKTKSVLMKSAKYEADPVVSKYHEFSKRYQGYIRELYEEVQESGLKNTHEKITELAFNISCADISEKIKSDIIKTCTGPDRTPSAMLLFMEGHFYGKSKSGSFCNFLPKYFGKNVTAMLGKTNDVYETALSNFTTNYRKFKSDNTELESLGWSLHYAQDITSPPHAGNHPAILPRFKCNEADTHHYFEKIARERINDTPDFFMNKAIDIYKELKLYFLSINADLEKFGNELYNRTSPYINNIRKKKEKKWNIAIDETLPLAIAATAVLIDESFN